MSGLFRVAMTLRKSLLYSMYRSVGGFQSQSGWFGEEKSLTRAANQNQDSTVVQHLNLCKLAKP